MEKTDNELIAEFMGGVYYSRGDIWRFPVRMDVIGGSDKCNPVHIKYHTSWDWLMPVVEKIEQLYLKAFPGNEEFIRRILNKEEPLDGPYMDVISIPLSTKIDEAHKAVVEFIKWYNENKS